MARVVRDRGPNGKGSILFRQDLDYPRVPGHITYYPPEPSDELQKQVRKDKAGGLALYIIGVSVALLGLLGAMDFSSNIEIYATLIPILLILGLVFAIMYLAMDNVALAEISRTLPAILMVCLIIFYIISILTAVLDMGELIDNANQNSLSNGLDNIFESLLNPAFFFMSAGLMICRAGGTMLWTSTKILQQYIPGMIIIENPKANVPVAQQPQPQHHIEEYVEDEPDPNHLCESCAQPMTFIKQYDRHYCYDCGTYGPK